MNSIGTENTPQDGETGPMWSRFFDSFAHQDDNESAISGSHLPGHEQSSFGGFQSPTRHRHHRDSPIPEINPNDSASGVNEHSLLEMGADGGAPISTVGGTSVKGGVPVDDGTYVFKFRTPSGRTHRFQARSDNYENIVDIVAGKLSTDPFFDAPTEGPAPDPEDFTLSYTDSDGDTVLVTSDTDVADAVRIARESHSDRVVLFLQGGKGWDEAGGSPKESEKKAREAAKAAAVAEEEVSMAEASGTGYPDGGQSLPPPANSGTGAVLGGSANDEIFGIPRDLVLPASLGFLGVVIIGVFVAARMTAREF